MATSRRRCTSCEKHVEGLFGLNIPGTAKERIRGTKNVGKSKPCSFDIKSDEVLPAFETVMRYKLDAK